MKTYYLLTFKDQNGYAIFQDEKNRKLFLRLYEYFIGKEVTTYSWSIMPKKALFLCSVKYHMEEASPFKEAILYRKESFDHLINLFNDYLRKEYSEHIFLDASAKHLDDYPESFLAGFSAYIHCLPVFQGLADTYVEYGWSSYLPLLHQKYTFLHYKTVMGWFGSKEEYRRFHHQMLNVKKARDVYRNSEKYC